MTTLQPQISFPDALTLQILLQALHNLETPLSSELIADINKIGESLASNQSITLAIRSLIKKDDNLAACYRDARKILYEVFEFDERNKAGEPEEDETAADVIILQNKLPRIIQILIEPNVQTAIQTEVKEEGFESIQIVMMP